MAAQTASAARPISVASSACPPSSASASGGSHGRRPDAGQGNARLRYNAVRNGQGRCHCGERKVAAAAGNFFEAPAGFCRQFGEHDFSDDVAGAKIDGQRAEEKVARGDLSIAGGRGDVQFGVEQHRHHRQFGSRVGMAKDCRRWCRGCGWRGAPRASWRRRAPADAGRSAARFRDESAASAPRRGCCSPPPR